MLAHVAKHFTYFNGLKIDMYKSVIFSLLLMGSLILLVPFANTNLFSNAMAQGYNDYGDSSYSTYPTDDKKYECRTGPFEGFLCLR